MASEVKEEGANFLENLKKYLPDWVLSLPEEEQREYIQRLGDHFHRHQREEEEALSSREAWLRTVQANYKPKHPHVFDFDRWKFSDSFSPVLDNLKCAKGWTEDQDQQLRSLLEQPLDRVFSFDMLSVDFCEQLVEEVQHFERWCTDKGLHVQRPNSMNRYGAILDDFGFDKALDRLMREVVSPLAKFVYKDLGKDLCSHHGFVVEYQPGKDTNLGFHVDDSQVTLNVCLGHDFSGGDLYFGGVRCPGHQQTAPLASEEYLLKHRKGWGVLHLGKHRHSARDVTSGYRCNLILWCRQLREEHAGDKHGHRCQCCHDHGQTECPSWCGLYKQSVDNPS